MLQHMEKFDHNVLIEFVFSVCIIFFTAEKSNVARAEVQLFFNVDMESGRHLQQRARVI